MSRQPRRRADPPAPAARHPGACREGASGGLRAGAPIRLHLLPGIPGRVGKARAAGFARGTLPLVSFVDPDDRYEADAFAHLADALDACPSAVLAYTDEALIDEHGRVIGVRRLAYSAFQHAHSASHVHGLIVMRRSAVELVLPRIADLDTGADWWLTRLVARQGSVLHLPLVGRHWRQHPNQHHRRAQIDERTIVTLARR